MSPLSWLTIDIICTAMMDVTTSIGVPSYVFSPISASVLGFICYMVELQDRHRVDVTKYGDSDDKLDFPAFLNPLPVTAVPQVFVTKETTDMGFETSRKCRDAKGLLINKFWELERVPLKYLSDLKLPPVYPVGPIVRLNGATSSTISSTSSNNEILEWLDNQPRLSVVFVCFGSIGSLGEDQVKEIAAVLESAGYRFLWSLKPLPHEASYRVRDDYATFEGIIPEGFLGRTAEVGRVMGWVPQAEILSPPSVGGFVSHCGWNSILESIWSGVPIAAWPCLRSSS
ncbi:hypothetical protein MLD38_014883 [Melastoma candidum]|uniref:Uncharacterized protein n=1 Tax=Melastoma candidum TaxID=119954 RepID=A0ACB9RDU4_9MYRT|nr:hypothetical protein MLD38_014883 [Melastoma candidum]